MSITAETGQTTDFLIQGKKIVTGGENRQFHSVDQTIEITG